MLIDSGSDWDLLSVNDWERLERDLDTAPGDEAKGYGAQTNLRASRSFFAWIEGNGVTKPKRLTKFRVIPFGEKSLISHETATKMKLLKVGVEVNAIAVLPKVLKNSRASQE